MNRSARGGMMNARELVTTLKGRWHGSYGMACCPAHQDRDPSLKVSDGDEKMLLYCFAGCPTVDVIAGLRARGLWEKSAERATFSPRSTSRQPDGKSTADDRPRNSEFARDLWHKAESAARTPVETYLQSRGITCPIPPTIRYLASAKHTATGLSLPCMIAAVTIWPSREVNGIHRTFLTLDGRKKAPVSNNKMMLGPCRGAAVRLAPEGPALVLAEGLETALSVLQSTGLPVWACLGTTGLKSVIVPNTVEEVIVAADGDDPGKAAAEAAAARFIREGRKVRIAHPPADMDFNDVLMRPENVVAFPLENTDA